MSSLRLPFILMLVISSVALFADVVSVYIGPIEYEGHLSFTYVEGEDPITRLEFFFDSGIADNLLVVDVPAGSSGVRAGDSLVFSGLSLLSGETYSVGVSLRRYLEPGGRPFTARGTTSEGEASVAEGSLLITETLILKVILIVFENQLLVYGGTVALGVAEVFLSLRKRTLESPQTDAPMMPEGPAFEPIGDEIEPEGLDLDFELADDEEIKPDFINKPFIPSAKPFIPSSRSERPKFSERQVTWADESDDFTSSDDQDLSCKCRLGWMHLNSKLLIGGAKTGWAERRDARYSKVIDLGEWRTAPMHASLGMHLRANHVDQHALIVECLCPKTGEISRKVKILWANYRIDWEVTSGKGGFASRSSDPPRKITKKGTGAQILLVPHLDDLNSEDSMKIRVTARHDDATKPPNHAPISGTLSIRFEKVEPEKARTEYKMTGRLDDLYDYKMTFNISEPVRAPLPKEVSSECVPELTWEEGSDIKGKITLIPKEVKPGEYVSFSAVGSDTDTLVINCKPGGKHCVRPVSKRIEVNDVLHCVWLISESNYMGMDLVWKAWNREGPVRIRFVTINDSRYQYNDEGLSFHDLRLNIKK